jgi:hypothetical protein
MSDRVKAVVLGVLLGSLLGATLAWIATDGYDDAAASENPIKALGPADYLSLGISILTLGRQFGAMIKRV